MKILIKVLSFLPLPILYVLSDYLLYPLMFYVIRYRRKICLANLRESFPNKTDEEIRVLQRRFYHHFADVIVEIIFSYRATDAQMREHIIFDNADYIEQLAQQCHGGVFLMAAHFGNWEWLADIGKRYTLPEMRNFNVYRQLHNANADQIMRELREKKSGKDSCIEKSTVLRTLVRLRKEQPLMSIGIISDQKPSPRNAHYWTDFLHHETSFLNGCEVLSQKFGYAVTYVHTDYIKRGYYRIHFELISDCASETPTNYITERYARMLEQNILEYPDQWLWTHNRWKWKKPIESNNSNL